MIQNQNYVEQAKPTKPQKQFDVNSDELIQYDDEKVMDSASPLPGM